MRKARFTEQQFTYALKQRKFGELRIGINRYIFRFPFFLFCLHFLCDSAVQPDGCRKQCPVPSLTLRFVQGIVGRPERVGGRLPVSWEHRKAAADGDPGRNDQGKYPRVEFPVKFTPGISDL